MSLRPTRFALLTTAALVLATSSARGDDAAARAAEVLFSEGRELMRVEKFEEACPKLARSQELTPAVGTLLNLGFCYEHLGRTATAWQRYREAASFAAQKRDRREAHARERVAALEPELARLTVEVATDVAKATPRVELDGAELPNASWGVAIPIDPGEHVVVATASEARTVTKRAHVDAKAQVVLSVDAFEAAPSPPATAPARPALLAEPPAPVPRREGSSFQRPLSFAVAGTGAATVVVSVIVGALAKFQYDSVSGDCTNNLCTQAARDTRNGAFDKADVASVLGISGLVVLAAGGVLWWTSRGSR